MITSEMQVTGASISPAPSRKAPAGDHGFSFHDILSAINPLQYLPVVGTIYRALTGDVIPEPLQRAGSLVVSGLLGGPVGVVTSIATTLAEKITGIDPEKIMAKLFNPSLPTAPARDESPAVTLASAVPPVPSPSTRLAMTPAQLSAYGVKVDAFGTLRLGDIQGADVLNTIELSRLSKAAAAYATAGHAFGDAT